MLKIMTPDKVHRILVVKPSSLGDILHTFPAVELLHRHFPEAELDWLVHPAFADVLDFSPFPVARKIFFRRKELGRISTVFREITALAGQLRAEKYDLIIDFQGLFRSAFFAYIARGAGVTGFACPREHTASFFYRQKINADMQLHAVERNAALVNTLLNTQYPVPECTLPQGKFPLSLPEKQCGKKLIGVIPGARWETKCFPEELFADVINRVHRDLPDTAFAVIGTPSEQGAAARILELAGECSFSMAGKTSVGQMMELMSRCCCVLSNDSGPVHAAAAFNIPVFAFFGATRPELTGPYSNSAHVYQLNLPCIKCMKRVCQAADRLACHRLDAALVASDIVNILKNGDKK